MSELVHYEILRDLASGGMGKVYVARHRQLGREVALKVIHAWKASDEMLQRFVREAQATARLRHSGVVAIHEVGSFQGQPCIVMDLIEGESLQDRVDRDGPLPSMDAARITRDLAAALAHAHSHGVLHRDLKPANVLMTPEGRVLITDFGIAKDLNATRGRLTRTGQMLGTPAYMPPEQVDGDATAVEQPSDVYGLGATLYALVAGQPPFTGETAINVISKVLSEPPQPPSKVVPSIATDLESVCLKCLAKAPADRYPTAAALGKDLDRFLAGEPVLGRPPRRRKSAHWVPLTAAALCLGAATVFAVSLRGAPPRTETPTFEQPSAPKAPTQKRPTDDDIIAKEDLADLERIKDARARYDALGGWLTEHPDHPKAARARTLREKARCLACFARFKTRKSNLCAIVWGDPTGTPTPNGLQVLAGGKNTKGENGLQLFQLPGTKPIGEWSCKKVLGLAQVSDRLALVTVERKLFQLARADAALDEVPAKRLSRIGSRMRPVTVNPTGTRVAIGCWGAVRVVPLAGEQLLSEAHTTLRSGDPGRCQELGFLDAARLVSVVAISGKKGRSNTLRVEVWNVETGKRLAVAPVAGGLRDAAVSTRSQRVAIAYFANRGAVSVYGADLQHPEELGRPGPNSGMVGLTDGSMRGVAFSPSGRLVHFLAKRPDETLIHGSWDLDREQLVSDPIVHPAEEYGLDGGLQVSADGRWLVILYWDRIEVWGVPVE